MHEAVGGSFIRLVVLHVLLHVGFNTDRCSSGSTVSAQLLKGTAGNSVYLVGISCTN